MVVLYCKETPGLHLGPGLPGQPNVIDFRNGYAEIDDDDPLREAKLSWVNGKGCPFIRILDVDEVAPTDSGVVKCPVCSGAFATDRKLNGHMLGAHRGKKG